MIQNVLVLGAGSAGLIAALSIKKKIPQLNVRVVDAAALRRVVDGASAAG